MTARKPRAPKVPPQPVDVEVDPETTDGFAIGDRVLHRSEDGVVLPGVVTSVDPPSVTVFMTRNERYLDSFEGCEPLR